jgi:lambda repressor-like predicted transcriptional regulator
MHRDHSPRLPRRETFTIQHEFVYNEESNSIDVNYSFKVGIVETISVKFPPSGGARAQRRQRGEYSSADISLKAAAAEQAFSERLGPAVERAIMESIHLALFKCGVGARKNPREMANLIAAWHRNLIASEITRRGARKGSKQSKVGLSKNELNTVMPRIIRDLLDREEEPTREKVAHLLGLANAKALDRLRERYNDHRKWTTVVAEVSRRE